jgi:hypothetical protein
MALTAPPTTNPPRVKPRWWFHLIAIGVTFFFAMVLVLAADIYLHHRLAPYAAVNIWGYRGEVLGRKQPNEKRILMVGPSTVFGVGFPPEQALPAQLERQMQSRLSFPVRVVNLGMPGEEAYAYRANVEDYRYLKPDAVIFYGDTNPIGRVARVVLRRNSPVFRLTGYYPIIHHAIREKAMLMQTGTVTGEPGKVVFRPGLAQRAGAATLEGAANVADYVQRMLGPLANSPDHPQVAAMTCRNEFSEFCDAMNDAVTYARSLGLRTLVVNQPYETPFQIQIQRALQVMLQERHGSDRDVRYLDLGNAIDLKDSTLTYDGVHLTPAGNAYMAGRLLEPALQLLGSE